MSIASWGLANPAGLLWGLLVIPMVLLHILRPRRVQARVSAVYLWRKVATPVTAASPWQRLIPSWLLAAQVLAALLLALLAARPVRYTEQPLADHTVFVIDASASMRALDGSPTRIELAVDRAEELREQLPLGGEASIVVAGNRARAILTHSPDEASFTEALATVRAGEGSADFASAFALAAGLDTAETPTRVVLISDGGVPTDDLRLAPVGTRYERVGTSATNRAITQLLAEPTDGGLLVRATVANLGGPDASHQLRVDVDGVTVARETIEIESGGVANLAIPVPEGDMIEAFLDGEDGLSLDNRAVATPVRRPELDVLWVGPDDFFIEAVLGSLPGVTVTREATYPSEFGPEVDVVVASGVAITESVEAQNTATVPLLAINPPGGARGVDVVGTVDLPILSLVRSDVPLVADLDWSNVRFAQSQKVTVPEGADVVLGAEGAPLLITADGDDGRLAYLAFDLSDSTLPLESTFPLLIDRLLTDLSRLSSPPARITVGADLPVDPRIEATITGPDGRAEIVPPGSSYPDADQLGFWRIEQPDRQDTLVAVVVDPTESSIAPLPDLPFSEAFEGSELASSRGEQSLRLWPILALLVLMAIEWLLARKRRGVSPRQWQLAGALRIAVALALLALLLRPSITRPANEVATIFLIDASDSMGAAGQAEAVAVVRDALLAKPEAERAGVVVFGRDARLEALVQSDPLFSGVSVVVEPSGTDIAAALRLGSAALPNDARRRLVMISDGRATTGDVAEELERIEDEGVPVDVVVIDPPQGNDLAIGAIDTPAVVRDGDAVTIDVEVIAPGDVTADVTLIRDGDVVDSRRVDLSRGVNTVRFSDVATDEAVLRYQVQVTADGDQVSANDVGYGAVPVIGAERVLIVEGQPSSADAIEAALGAGGLAFDVVTPDRLPPLDELTRYAAVVMVDVDRRDLSDGQLTALSGAVRNLGRGLVVVGGTHSYALGGYRESPLEELLPVISEVTDPLRRQTVAEVLAIDTSGSMGACHCDEEGANGLGGGNRVDGGIEKTAIARTAASRAIAALQATDEVGVLSMDADDSWLIDLQASPSQEVIDDGLNQLIPDGPTFVDTGLLTAATALRQSQASLKHIIFFSDGFTDLSHLDALREQAADLYAEGITVSVVATGEGAAEDLEPIAEAGGGRYYPGRNLTDIPDLIVEEAVIASRDFVNEGSFSPLLGSGTTLDLAASPQLQGYVATTAKPTAAVDLRIGPDEDPLLASWQVGLGRVTAWTSDGGERWATPWAAWSGAPDFWTTLVKDTFPVLSDGGGLQSRINDGQLTVELTASGAWPDDAVAIASVGAPDGTTTELTLERLDSGTFAATMPVGDAGTYAVGGSVGSGSGETVWSGLGLATRSYPAEYAPRAVDRQLMERVALVTGGRLEPEARTMFDADGTIAGDRHYDLSKWLLLFALLAWPVAVALSRLAWRRGVLSVGQAKAVSTVGQLRERLPKMAEPQLKREPIRASSSADQLNPTPPPVTPPPVAPPPVSPPADSSPAPTPPVQPEADSTSSDDSSSTVNRLLDRKRRDKK